MRPILLEMHGVRIYSYPAMLYIGMILGMVGGNYAANDAGLNSARVLIAMVLLTIPGLVGARLLFVATHWKTYRREPARIWRRSEGGASLQGGLFLMLLTSLPLLAALEIPFARFWDVAAITMLIGMIFAKVGCILNGCCVGQPSDGRFAMYLPDHRGVWCRRVPTQLLESGLAVVILLAVVGLWTQRPFHGAIFLSSLLSYSVARFALLAKRENQDWLGKLNIQQAICVAFGLLALAGLLLGAIGVTNWKT